MKNQMILYNGPNSPHLEEKTKITEKSFFIEINLEEKIINVYGI